MNKQHTDNKEPSLNGTEDEMSHNIQNPTETWEYIIVIIILFASYIMFGLTIFEYHWIPFSQNQIDFPARWLLLLGFGLFNLSVGFTLSQMVMRDQNE